MGSEQRESMGASQVAVERVGGSEVGFEAAGLEHGLEQRESSCRAPPGHQIPR